MDQGATASVTKSACEQYAVADGQDWAVITIIAVGEKSDGLGILSSYGNWSFAWSAPGTAGFKRFILRLDNSRDYLVGKLTHGRPRSFDCEATVAKIKEWIADGVRDGDAVRWLKRDATWDEEKASLAVGSLVDVESQWSHSADGFVGECLHRPYLSWLWEFVHDGIAEMVPDPACVEFVAKLWPHFVAEIRRELEGA